MKNKTIIMFVALGVIVMVVVGLSLATAFQGGFGKVRGTFEKSLTTEEIAEKKAFHESLMAAVESNDFDSWKILMESQLTEEKFNKLREKHMEMQELRQQFKGEFSYSDHKKRFYGMHNKGNWNHNFLLNK